jgi:ABC-type polysaccharide/polyol phosphate transport system ATPase subunit
MNSIEFRNVWKKFKKGEKLNSIRDAFPDFLRRLVNASKNQNILKDQEFWAVKDVSFDIPKGGVVAIMGPNGAGKSTILKMLSRIIVPNSGTLTINGRLSALIEVTAGFHPELTGRENVYLNGTILGMRKKEIDDRFDEIVEFSGVSEFIDTPVKRYSSGMFSRLGFSVAAHMNPDILLVDEVLSVGDIAFQAKCAQKMRELLGSGATIVLVSHSLSLIQSLCKRVILLQQGQVLKDGTPEDIIPLYQNLVYQKSEEEFRKKMVTQDRVGVDTRPLLSIPNAQLSGDNCKAQDRFASGDMIQLTFDYEAREKIESPIFVLDIVRADGVLCCSARSDTQGKLLDIIQGKGSIKVNFGKINLASGIYVAKISVWDREMVHPYIVRNRDVFRIEVDAKRKSGGGVFYPVMEWQVKK